MAATTADGRSGSTASTSDASTITLSGYAGPDRIDYPGDLAARNVRQCGLDLIPPLDEQAIDEAEPGGFDADSHLPGAGLG